MTHATSPFLNKPLRSESQATAEIEHAASERSRDERRRRLDDHGTVFCRTILDGAFERVYQPDGSYTLCEFQSPATQENQALEARAHVQADATLDLPEPGGSDGVARSGYVVALRDLSRWVAKVAAEPAMDATTLNALNREIARLSHAMETAPIAGC